MTGLAVAPASILGFTVGHLLAALSGWIDAGAAWLLGQVGHGLGASTSVDLGAGWFLRNYRSMAAVAAVTVLPFLLCAAIQAVVTQRAGLLVRSALVHLPVALLLSGVAVQIVAMGLAVTDAMSSAVSSGTGVPIAASMQDLERATGSLGAAGSQVPGFAVVLIAVLVALGAVMLWLELLVREAAVYVTVLFLPLALAGLVWPATAHWCRRLVDSLVAVVLSKFVIVSVLTLAMGAVGSVGAPDGFAAVLAGVALLVLATCMPLVLLHLVPLAADGAMSGLEEVRHRAARVAVAVPRSAASIALGQAGAASLGAVAPGTGLEHPVGVPGAPGGEHAAPGWAATGMVPQPGAPTTAAQASSSLPGSSPSGSGPAATAVGTPPGGTPQGGDGAGGGVPMWAGRGDVDLRVRPSASSPPAAGTQFPVAPGAGLGEGAEPPPRPSGVPGAISGVPVPWHVPTGAGAADAGSARASTGAAGGAGATYRIDQDDLGPVIRWVPGQDVPGAGPSPDPDGLGPPRGPGPYDGTAASPEPGAPPEAPSP